MGHLNSPERGSGGRGRSQRDFSCPGQKKESGPDSPRPPASSPSPCLPSSFSHPFPPAFLTQLPTVMDDDMCHIATTCVHRVGGWAGRRRPNRRSELSAADMWHSNLRRLRRVSSCRAGKESHAWIQRLLGEQCGWRLAHKRHFRRITKGSKVMSMRSQ